MIQWIKSFFKKDEKLQAVKDSKDLLANALGFNYSGITPTIDILDGLEACRDFYRLVDLPDNLKDVERRIQFVADTAWLNKYDYDNYSDGLHKSSDIFIGRLWRSFDDDYTVAV